MALTKDIVVEPIQTGHGFPKNKAIDPTESLLEPITSTAETVDDGLVSGLGQFWVKEKSE